MQKLSKSMDDSITIQLATADNLDVVVDLVYENFLYHDKLDDHLLITEQTVPLIRKEFLRRLTDYKFRIFLAKKDNHVVGLVCLSIAALPLLMGGERTMRIEDLYTKEEYRGMGIATALMNRCFSFATTQDVKALSVNVLSNNESTIAFYNKLGFEIGSHKMMKQL